MMPTSDATTQTAPNPSASDEILAPGGWLVVYAGLSALLLLAALTPLLTLDEVPRIDGLTFFVPAFSAVADHARAGELLLWNPWIGAGRPEAADPQVGAFSPVTLAMAAATGGGFRGYALALALSWWAAGLGIFVLGRHLGAPGWGSAAVALSYLTSGFLISHVEHFPQIHGAASLAWVTWRLDVALCARRLLPAAQAGALYGLFGLTGYPGLMICLALWLGIWTIGRALLGDDDGQRVALTRAAAALGLTLAVASAVLAPSYLAFLVEGRDFSARAQGVDRHTALEHNALPVDAMRTAASPVATILKLENEDALWPETHHAMVAMHLGLAATCLAILGLLGPTTPRFRWAVVAAGGLLLLSAFGSATPIRGWLVDLLPPMRFFRYAAIQRSFALLALAILALWGTRALAMGLGGGQLGGGQLGGGQLGAGRRGAGRSAARRLAVVAVGVGALAALSSATLFAAVPATPRSLGLELLWIAAVLGGLAAVAHGVAEGRLPRRALASATVLLALLETGRTLRLTEDLISVPLPISQHALHDVDRGRPTAPSLTLDRRQSLALEPLLPGDRRLPQLERTNLDYLTGTPAFPSYETLTWPVLTAWRESPRLSAWVLGEDRLWFAPSAEVQDDSLESFHDFERRTADAGSPLLWLHEFEDGQTAASTVPASRFGGDSRLRRVDAELLAYDQRTLRVRVDAPSDGWLWVTDRYAAGWRAWVDEVEVDVERGSFLFRALPIPSGVHEVTMRYTPFGHPWLWILSWSTLAAVLVGSVWRRRRAASRRVTSLDLCGGFD
ncbi:MAG: YfhO family protein [Acidobacteriota bacterium]